MSLFEHLGPEERETVERFFRQVSFAEGSYLYRRGSLADGCYLLDTGTVALEATVPALGDVTTETLGPGDVVGESILVHQAPRVESAKATSAVRAHFVDARSIPILETLLGPPHTRLLVPFATQAARRLQQFSRLEAIAAWSDGPTAQAPPLGSNESPGCSFDVAPFLPVLRVFKEFSPEDLQRLLETACLWEVPRGRKLFSRGETTTTLHLLLRGAVETRLPHQTKGRRLQLFGPGRMLDPIEFVLGIPRVVDCQVRESAVLMTLDRTEVLRALENKQPLATKLFGAAAMELLVRLDKVRRMVAARVMSLQLNLAV